MRRIDEFTGLRALAVGTVVLGHSRFSMPHAIGKYIPSASGDVGVQIFFVLSGYLITRILMDEYARGGTINFWGFYRRRILRIAPAFYTYILVIAALTLFGFIHASWQQFVISGTYLWNYAHMLRLDGSFDSHQQGWWYLGHTWSLALEEQFYWIWPAAFLLISRKNLRYALPAAIIIVPLIRMASYILDPHDRAALHLMFHTGSDTILVGCFLAMHQEALAARLKPYLTSPLLLTLSMLLVVGVLNLAQSHLGGGYVVSYGLTLSAIAVAFMMLAILHQPGHWFSRLLRTRAFMGGGLISYSLYLWQQLFDNAAMPIHLEFPLGTAAAIGAAMASYHFVEKPFLRLKDRSHAKRAAVPDAATAAASAE